MEISEKLGRLWLLSSIIFPMRMVTAARCHAQGLGLTETWQSWLKPHRGCLGCPLAPRVVGMGQPLGWMSSESTGDVLLDNETWEAKRSLRAG